MQSLIADIRQSFESKRHHLEIFAQTDCRLEGWFKGELLVLFTELVREGRLDGFRREAPIPAKIPGRRLQIDFQLHLNGETHLCELRSLCTSQAAGTPRNLNFYFRDDGLGIVKDIRKLEMVDSSNKWLLAFVYPTPSPETWRTAVNLVPKELQHWRPLDSPSATTLPVFISLWSPGVTVQ